MSVTLTVSLLLHLAVLLGVGSALFDAGEDDRNLPELSVQIETREGPSEQEFRDAALPIPRPPPPQQVLDDPGTAAETLETAAPANEAPQQESIPDARVAEADAAHALSAPDSGSVIATSSPVEDQVFQPPQPVAAAAVQEAEQRQLTRQVEKLSQRLLDSNLTQAELTWQEAGHQYSARLIRQPAADSTGMEQVIAEVMTDRDGKRMKTRLSLKRLAFSHYTQLVNHWDRNIMLHDDVIDGRFHSNSQFAFTASKEVSPRFFGKVTTAASTLTFNGFNKRRGQEVFTAGYETHTDRVMLPREMEEILNSKTDVIRHRFSEDTRIIFNPDGSFVWRLANGQGELHRVEASAQPRYLIGERGAKLFVRGTVAGMFTVYTPYDIEIEDDLVYAHDPRFSLASRDFLALIAGRDVSISAPEVTGPGDLTVHGALFAYRRFVIERAELGRKGAATLRLYGSLTAGTLSESEPRYATHTDFDKRFEYLRPAGFPLTRRYEVDTWSQQWEEDAAPGAPVGESSAPPPGS